MSLPARAGRVEPRTPSQSLPPSLFISCTHQTRAKPRKCSFPAPSLPFPIWQLGSCLRLASRDGACTCAGHTCIRLPAESSRGCAEGGRTQRGRGLAITFGSCWESHPLLRAHSSAAQKRAVASPPECACKMSLAFSRNMLSHSESVGVWSADQ